MYREHSSGAALTRWVECCWTFESAEALDHAVRPDGCLDIVYSPEIGLRVVGAMTVEQRHPQAAGSTVVGVRFRPGLARHFLKTPPGELTGLFPPLEQLWGRRARELESRLGSSPTALERAQLLLNALPMPSCAPDALERAMGAMTAANGAIDLDWTATQAGMSTRQFRRRCFEESGLTPKRLCRILRFRRSLELAASHRLSWAAIAADAGYFDQAHLIRDFREFTGQAPMAVFSNTEAAGAGKN